MINSGISSNHHYYVFFFELTNMSSLSNIASIFDCESDFEIFKVDSSSELDFCHLQLELDKIYGSEAVLLLNKNPKKKNPKDKFYYWYDFYIGSLYLDNKKIYYVCYPYSGLGKFLTTSFQAKSIKTVFFKPQLALVLEYMAHRNISGISIAEKNGFTADITKYAAQVKDDENKANKVTILGENPLKSKTFEILNRKDQGISIETVSLKLSCKQENVGEIELSFDKLGNYRFWLKKNAQEITIPSIPFAFKFLMEVAPLERSTFISSNTLLENE